MGEKEVGEGISEPPYSGFSGVNSQSFPSTRQGNTWHCIVLTVQSVGRIPLAASVAAVSGAEGPPKTVKQVLHHSVLPRSKRQAFAEQCQPCVPTGRMPTVAFDKVAGLCELMKTAHEESRNLARHFNGL
jgi:hypothetical protein